MNESVIWVEQSEASYSSQDDDLLREMLKGIERMGRGRAVPILRRVLRSKDRALPQFACISLGDAGGRRAMRLLIDTMRSDSSLNVRLQAAHALSFFYPRQDQEQAYPALRDVFANLEEHGVVRAQAVEGIGYILGWTDRRLSRFREAEKLLLAGLRDESPEVRFWSVFALSSMRSRKALPEFTRMAETDHVKCRNMWLVSEEASDAVAVFDGQRRPQRNTQWDGDYEEDEKDSP